MFLPITQNWFFPHLFWSKLTPQYTLLLPLDFSVHSEVEDWISFISVFPALAQCLAPSRTHKTALDLGTGGRSKRTNCEKVNPLGCQQSQGRKRRVIEGTKKKWGEEQEDEDMGWQTDQERGARDQGLWRSKLQGGDSVPCPTQQGCPSGGRPKIGQGSGI